MRRLNYRIEKKEGLQTESYNAFEIYIIKITLPLPNI